MLHTTRTMYFISFVCLFVALKVEAFLPVAPLTDCPKVTPQNGVRTEQVAGTWRLAYLFIDDNDELEEDNTCAVVEIMQVNETKMEILLYVDGKKDEHTIDRYTKQFEATILEPGEWLLHTPFLHLEFMHVTVIGLSQSHLLLTFCANPYATSSEPPTALPETFNDYDEFINSFDGDSLDDIFKAQKYNRLFKELDDLNGRLERQRRIRRPSRLLRGKRSIHKEEDESLADSSYDKMVKYLREHKEGMKPQKHLWTAILVKDNNVSALRFVENASLLMKFGFNITKGQLVSFGSCTVGRK